MTLIVFYASEFTTGLMWSSHIIYDIHSQTQLFAGILGILYLISYDEVQILVKNIICINKIFNN